jgi:oligopeptidase B
MVAPTPSLAAPVPARRPHMLREHGDERIDEWYWLRERDNPEVRAHLEAENAYTAAVLAPTHDLEAQIFGEIKGRVRETDVSAPVPDGPWEYLARTYEGRSYAVHVRRPRGGSEADEVVLLDENVEADGHDYFALGVFDVTPDHRLYAYAVDNTGGERFALGFRDAETGRDLDDRIDDVGYAFAWADDGRTCFYTRLDDAMRPWQVWRHELGADAADDALVFQEDDDRFYVGVGRTRSGRYVIVESGSKTTTEAWFVASAAPTAALRVVVPRRQDHEYSVEHHVDDAHGDRFLIVTNDGGARNFRLVAAPVDDPGREHWVELVPHRDDVRLESVDAFRDHLVLTERANGLTRLRVLDVTDAHNGPSDHELSLPDPVYTVWVGANAEYDTRTLRYGYTSLVAPTTDVDYDMETRDATVVKVQPVPGYDASQYASERVWSEQPDGTRVPLSVVYRRDVARDGSAPLLLYGYGSYEISIDASFRPSRLSLLDRGFVYAIAHVRGGGELGREWYEQGRREHKRNTFTDFVGCAETLIAEGYTATGRIVARGGSAGGLLMGAIVNARPELFAAVIAEVPFVDVLTTMLDPTLPLTITERDEWGDPRERDAYEWMKEYSPYDNVHDAPYPTMFVTSGLNDPRVSYWEPTKWVAKLRDHTTSDRPIVLRTELGAGHGGPSGRYDAWHEEASILAFACATVGITK